MKDLNSPKALVCHQQHRADCGVGTVWFVCLADGYLIDCGAEVYSEARADILASFINTAPEKLDRDSLKAWRKV
jgi:hypothetical protein